MFKKLSIFTASFLICVSSSSLAKQGPIPITKESTPIYGPPKELFEKQSSTVQSTPTPLPRENIRRTPYQNLKNRTLPPHLKRPPKDKPDIKKEDKEENKVPAKGNVIIKFKEGNIKKLINEFSEILGKNFTYDNGIKGKITLIGPNEVSKREARKIFESALERMGYVIIWGWPINKVVPVADAKSQGNIKVY